MKALHKIEKDIELVEAESKNTDSANVLRFADFQKPVTHNTKKECIASYDKDKNIERLSEILRVYATPEWIEGLLKIFIKDYGPKENPQIVKERNIQKAAEILRVHTEPEYVEAVLTRLIKAFNVQDRRLTIVNETDYWEEF